MSDWPFGDLPRAHYGAIYADPPWLFNNLWGGRPKKTEAGYPSRAVENHYNLQTDGSRISNVMRTANPFIRYDRHGAIAIMTSANGYHMVRRPRCFPFVMSEKEWFKLADSENGGKTLICRSGVVYPNPEPESA